MINILDNLQCKKIFFLKKKHFETILFFSQILDDKQSLPIENNNSPLLSFDEEPTIEFDQEKMEEPIENALNEDLIDQALASLSEVSSVYDQNDNADIL